MVAIKYRHPGGLFMQRAAISRKVKHKELDGEFHGHMREKILSVVFSHVKLLKLHKNRPGSFFANKPL
jgi:hypothetical protein